MFSDQKWIKAVMFRKWAIWMLSPQLNAQADSIDFQILQNIIIQRMAESVDISVNAHRQQPRQEVHQQPSQQPEARRGLAAINLWGSLPSIPQVIISHTSNQKYL